MRDEGEMSLLPKKEALKLDRVRERLGKISWRVKRMDRTPDIIFIIDPKKEKIAVHESE